MARSASRRRASRTTAPEQRAATRARPGQPALPDLQHLFNVREVKIAVGDDEHQPRADEAAPPLAASPASSQRGPCPAGARRYSAASATARPRSIRTV